MTNYKETVNETVVQENREIEKKKNSAEKVYRGSLFHAKVMHVVSFAFSVSTWVVLVIWPFVAEIEFLHVACLFVISHVVNRNNHDFSHAIDERAGIAPQDVLESILTHNIVMTKTLLEIKDAVSDKKERGNE